MSKTKLIGYQEAKEVIDELAFSEKLDTLSKVIDATFNTEGVKVGWILMVSPTSEELDPIPIGAISNGPREWIIELLKFQIEALQAGEDRPPNPLIQ